MIDLGKDAPDPTLHHLTDLMIIGGRDLIGESYYVLGRSEEIVREWVALLILSDGAMNASGVPTQREDGLWSCCVKKLTAVLR